jgi:hypothetical protein
MGELQEFAALPSDVVDDTPAVEASMQADRDKARLARHESRSIGHQRERFMLLFRLGFDDGDWVII